MLPDLKLEIGDKALFESKEKIGQQKEAQKSSFLLRAEALEGVLGLLVLLGINYFWFENNPGFLGIHPHPYWFILIPIAVRYGLFAGLVAGSTAFVVQLYIKFFLLEQDSQSFGLFNHAFVFLIISAGVGFFGEIRRVEHVKLKHDFTDLEKNFSNMLTEYNALLKYKEKKNTEIISQEDTFSSLYKAQEKINSLDENEIYPPLIDLLKQYLFVSSAAIYIIKDDKTQLNKVAHLTDDQVESHPDIISTHSDEIYEILQKGRILSINDLVNRPELLDFFNDKIMCAPIRGVRNRPLGIIVINRVPFNRLTMQAYKMLKSISDRCGASIEKARVYKMTRDKMVLDEITGVLTYSYLKERFDEEFSRARRYGYTISVLVFEIQSFYGCDIKLQQEALLSFKVIIERRLRNIDLLFHGDDRSKFILALPNTPVWGSRTVRTKLIQEMSSVIFDNGEESKTSFDVIGGVACMSPTITTYEDLLEVAFLDLNFQKKLNESFAFACQSDESVALLLFEIMDFEKFSEPMQQNITQIIEPLLKHYSSEYSCLYTLEHSAMYALFFSNREQQSVNGLAQEILKEIKAFRIKPYENQNKDLLVLAGALNAKPDMKTPESWKRKVMDFMYNSEVMLLFRYKFDNAKVQNAPLTVMVVEIADFQIFSDDSQKDIISSLSLIFQQMLGDLDIMFYDSAPSRHVLFLFHINYLAAQNMRERILTEIRSFDFKPYTYEERSLQIEAGIAQLSEAIPTPDELITKADEDLKFVKHVWYACMDAKKKAMPFCISSIEIADFENIPESIRKDLIQSLETVFFQYQENSEMILSLNNNQLYLILFTNTTYNGAVVLNMSICDEISDFSMRPYRGKQNDLQILSKVFAYSEKDIQTHYQMIQKAMHS